ncbi:MAG TPA: glycerol-3-phosphate 1-O-acyltransferase PlsY [Bryocella sp.]|nr:glycerol-3-phosphate 1-O-acyltransferase PlsY [Bryocella sp.]
MLINLVVASVIAFLLGSIPFGLILVRIFRGIDVRHTGSGNIGSANVARVAPALGAWTLVLDSAKGYVAVVVAKAMAAEKLATTVESRYIPLLIGASVFFAVFGHMFSVFLKGKGGKGVATAMGAFLAVAPLGVLIIAVCYVLIYAASHYTSLASIISAAIFPAIAAFCLSPTERPMLLPFIAVTCLLIILKHHQNIRRLLSGTENRLELKHR